MACCYYKGYRIQDTRYKMQDEKKIQVTRFRIQDKKIDAGYRKQDKKKIQDAGYRMNFGWHPVSCILYPAS